MIYHKNFVYMCVDIYIYTRISLSLFLFLPDVFRAPLFGVSPKTAVKALAKTAVSVPHDYQIGDLVVYRKDNVPAVSSNVWSITSRVIGQES